MRRHVAVLCAVAAATVILVVVAARAQSETERRGLIGPPVGATCDVQFRRDALGLASRMIVSPSSGGVASAETGVGGLFLRMDESWLVLARPDEDGVEVWIPREAVLTLEVRSK